MPLPPDPPDYGRLVEELARRLAAEVRAGKELDVTTPAREAGIDPRDVFRAFQQEEAKFQAAREQDEQRLVRLRERAESARTPEGQARLREESGLRSQLGAARARAIEPMGPPSALNRQAEREDREAAAARRFTARIGEQEEGKAARQRDRDDRARQREESREQRTAEREQREDARYTRSQAAGTAFAALGGAWGLSGAAARAVRRTVEFAGEANPEAAGTYAGSTQALRQAVGETAPAQRLSRAMSASAQGWAEVLRGQRSPAGGFGVGFRSLFGGQQPDTFRQNLNLPVGAETFGGGEDYYLSLQRAVTEASANTLDAKNLRDQLDTLRKQNELLGDVADNTDRIRNLTPPWRQ